MPVNKTKIRTCAASQPSDQQTTCADEIAISVKNLTKKYRIFGHPGDRIKQALTFGRVRFHREFTALKEVSFEIKKGETVGIIGRNGSGKSTLLQLICGILKPTSGTVQVNGRVSALLELGAGFNPEFTGRENVYFQGAILGIPKEEMDNRFDEIAAFADIGEFIDQPIRTYSSGMFVRLAFAVAVHVEPDILVVDEALAVGDAAFQAKCFRYIQGIRDRGGSIVFVTHAAEQVVRICDRVMLFDQGRLTDQGDPKDIINQYLHLTLSTTCDRSAPSDDEPVTQKSVLPQLFHLRPGYSAGEYRWGNGSAEITDFSFLPASPLPGMPRFVGGQELGIRFLVVFHREIKRPTFAISISTPDGVTLFGVNSRDLTNLTSVPHFCSGSIAEAGFRLSLHLGRGDYIVSLSVSEEVNGHLEPLDRRYDAIQIAIDNPLNQRGFVDLSPSFTLSRQSL